MIKCSERLRFTLFTLDEVQYTENTKKESCIHLILDQAFDNCQATDAEKSYDNLLQRLLAATRAIGQVLKDDPSSNILICQRNDVAEEVRESVLLFGGYLILAQVMCQQQVVQLFQDFANQPLPNASGRHLVTISDCWQALQHVRDVGWMNWKDGADEEDQPFLVDEFAHYADTANGGVYIISPGQLLLFGDPVDLPDHQQWISVVGDGERCATRRFSPAFYADLFADLGVAAVACLTESGSRAAALISTTPEPISGTSSSKSRLISPGCVRLTTIWGPLVVLRTSTM